MGGGVKEGQGERILYTLVIFLLVVVEKVHGFTNTWKMAGFLLRYKLHLLYPLHLFSLLRFFSSSSSSCASLLLLQL